MIHIQGVSKSYGSHKLVIDNLNLEMSSGEIIGFLGPNGAGKTTTIKMITGISAPQTGTILINGKNIQTNPVEAKKQFGYVADQYNLFLNITGNSYLNFMADIYEIPVSTREQAIRYLSEKLNISPFLNQKIKSYSHGTKQKLAMIGAMLHNPKVLILDEPLTGLDPRSSHELKNLMLEHRSKGNSVFFSTHMLEVAESLCDRIAVIHQGKLIFYGTLIELKKALHADESLENLFLKLTHPE